jgi:hypothetical protein
MPMNQIHIQYVEKKDILPASVYYFPICKPDGNQLVFLKKFLRIMRGTQGALIVASALQIIVGFSGLWRNVAR